MEKKTVLLGVTGGIAAYKMADFSHFLVKKGYDVNVVMTKNAQEFITPLTFETLTNNPCVTDTFARTGVFDVHHISLAKKANVVMIAPATANIIAKLANGIADDALTTQVLACKCPKIVAPAMNTAMLENIATQRNISTLIGDGFDIVDSFEGLLACGDVGKGKLPDNETLLAYIERALTKKDLLGKNVLISAGGTQESIDPVRYITNHSTGKMGYKLAYECMLRGANVTLVSAPTNLRKPMFVNTIDVKSADDMYNEIRNIYRDYDIIIKSAAVADFTPVHTSDNKIKKSGNTKTELLLKATTDILDFLGNNRTENQFICGFSMETENLVENSTKKLHKKNVDMIVANNLKINGAGFGVDTNVVTIITKDTLKELPLMSKADVAHNIVNEVVNKIG